MKKAKNLEIKIDDTEEFIGKKTKEILKPMKQVQGQEDKGKFDLIFVDMYLGNMVPQFLRKEFFLKKLKRILAKNGLIVFNCLNNKNYIFTHKIFLDKLKKIFDDVSYKKVLSNLIIFGKNN